MLVVTLLQLSGLATALAGFNGDGFADLAVGCRRDTVHGVDQAGSVDVVYGDSRGFVDARSENWNQSVAGENPAEAFDWFGSALAVADFNGDGWVDLAVGIPHEGIDAAEGAGAVQVLYGAASGLGAAGCAFWHQGSPGIDGDLCLDGRFGAALAAGDFDGDGYADLAVGIPSYLEPTPDGAVQVLYGSASGVSDRDQLWEQHLDGTGRPSESGAGYGESLAAGDFNGDGLADLAIGLASRCVDDVRWAGEVHVLYGTGEGLATAGAQFFNQNSDGVADSCEWHDRFGAALAAGDYNGDGRADLAIGVDSERDTAAYEGAFHVLYGTPGGLSGNGSSYFTRTDMGGGTVHHAALGRTLAAGDFDGDGCDDLAVGAPQEGQEVFAHGATFTLYGSAEGIQPGAQAWRQGMSGLGETPEDYDHFGDALAAGDFDGDGTADLAIGVPDEGLDGLNGVGCVHVVFGSEAGLGGGAFQYLDPEMLGFELETYVTFGSSLAAAPGAAIPTTPTPSPTSSVPTATPTSAPGPSLGVRLSMPAEEFHPGDPCHLLVTLYSESGPLTNVLVFVILDVYGSYWYWPGWTPALDYEVRDVPAGQSSFYAIDPFIWPDTGGEAAAGIIFWGAMMDASMSEVLGGGEGVGFWVFGYGP